MEKSKLTGSEIKDFVQKYLGFSSLHDEDDLRSDLRLDEWKIEEVVEACNKQFEANAQTDHLQKVKQLIKRVKFSAKVNCVLAE